jgi:hypothetical protein
MNYIRIVNSPDHLDQWEKIPRPAVFLTKSDPGLSEPDVFLELYTQPAYYCLSQQPPNPNDFPSQLRRAAIEAKKENFLNEEGRRLLEADVQTMLFYAALLERMPQPEE